MDTEYLRSLGAAFKATQARINKAADVVQHAAAVVKTVPQYIDALPGRRVVYTLSGDVTFSDADNRLRGQPITMLVSQDGPFVLTHYPVISWKPSLPTTASNLGIASAIRSWPMPAQQVNLANDTIDVSYELIDATAKRNCQNLTVSSQVVSTGDNLIPLPVPILFVANTRLQLFPTYHNIFFNGGAVVDTTQGTLHCDLLGYRIATM